MRSNRQRMRRVLVAVVAVQLAATPALAQTEVWDPWEGFNRKSYAVSRVVDRYALRPAATAYSKLPKPLRKGVRNFVRNLREPLVFVNDVLQGRPKAAGNTLGRFAMNSTVGVIGVVDVAQRAGLPHHNNGFGTTLGRWGAQPGPYLYLPVFGPSNLRDGVGTIGDFVMNPLDYVDFDGRRAIGVTTSVLAGLDARAEAQPTLDIIDETSIDSYATLRSYFMQNREAAIHGETAPEDLPDFDEAPVEPEPAPDAATPPAAPEAAPTPSPEPEPEPLPPEEPAASSPQPRSVSPSGASD